MGKSDMPDDPQSVFRLNNDTVDLNVTRSGGHLSGVCFNGDKSTVRPYAQNPWQEDGPGEGMPNLLKVLGADFFCLPFGESRCTPHPHGATANLDWHLISEERGELVLQMQPEDIGGTVTKRIRLCTGHRAIYQEHAISGLEGEFNYGHHPILYFPDQDGPATIRTGPITFGQVYPHGFENPAAGGYSCLKPGAEFHRLDQVPLANGGTTSLLEYPAREGFEDLVLFSAKDPDFAWTAVTLDGYVWVALKCPRQFPGTLFWISNGGRHYPPWNGRHRRRMGIEDVCSYFHEGLESSREHHLPGGIPTTASFNKDHPTVLRHIQMVHPLDADFGVVESVERDKEGKGIRLINSAGNECFAPVDWNFLNV